MRRHVKGNDLVMLTEITEFHSIVAIMAVYNEELVRTSHPTLCMLIEVLQPCKTMLKERPTFFTNQEDPIGPIHNRLVLGIILFSTFKDNEGRH